MEFPLPDKRQPSRLQFWNIILAPSAHFQGACARVPVRQHTNYSVPAPFYSTLTAALCARRQVGGHYLLRFEP